MRQESVRIWEAFFEAEKKQQAVQCRSGGTENSSIRWRNLSEIFYIRGRYWFVPYKDSFVVLINATKEWYSMKNVEKSYFLYSLQETSSGKLREVFVVKLSSMGGWDCYWYTITVFKSMLEGIGCTFASTLTLPCCRVAHSLKSCLHGSRCTERWSHRWYWTYIARNRFKIPLVKNVRGLSLTLYSKSLQTSLKSSCQRQAVNNQAVVGLSKTI